MNFVLYRKYRPKTFREIVGQEHIVKTLTNAIALGKVSHAYLFSGPRGTGKTTIARLLAKALNCQGRKEGEYEPCNQCQSCQEIDRGVSIDLVEIDAASNRGIDEIRELKERVKFRPLKSKYKIFIIDESHQLTKEAANALLKTLEEPPSNTVFILATTEIQKMIPTIISRCQTFSFRRLMVPEISKKLEDILNSEKIKFDKEALDLIALSARGSIRDAESLLDEVVSFSAKNDIIKVETIQQLLGITDKSIILKFIEMIGKKQAKDAVEYLNELILKGIDPIELVKSLIQYLREILMLKINKNSASDSLFSILPQETVKSLNILAKQFTEAQIEEMIEKLISAQDKMKFASIVQLPLELAIIEFCKK